MANKTKTIRIESILGGEAPYVNFADSDQFTNAYAIDPDVPANTYFGSSGIIAPFITDTIGTTSSSPMWVITNPKNDLVYVYDAVGSVYSYDNSGTLTGLADLNDGGSSHGNGAAYYDNYIYFARDTTVARYGPLDGTAAFTDDYWVGTLGKTALTDTEYPIVGVARMPNHVMHRHSDGALYFGDVVGNQGVIHKISTSKTTVEGDTDSGSTYNAVDFGYGVWPTALSSYGDRVSVSLFEGVAQPTGARTRGMRAKMSFWDPTNTVTYDLITNEEFPDPYISALLNSNGVLYTFSGETDNYGVRVSRYAGGYTHEEVASVDFSSLPYPGAVDGMMNKVVFGGYNRYNERPVLYSIGLRKSRISNSIFSVMGTRQTSGAITAAKFTLQGPGTLAYPIPVIGTTNSSNNTHYLETGVTPSIASSVSSGATFISAPFRIGEPFKVTKISFFVLPPYGTTTFPADSVISSIIATDSLKNAFVTGLHTSTTHPNCGRIVVRPTGVTGEHDLNFILVWNGTKSLPVSLPVTIEYELLDD